MESSQLATQLAISAEERDYLLRVLESKRKGHLVEIHHTDSRAYRERIKQEIDLIEALLSKITKSA